MGYMLFGAFLVVGSMGALEVDHIGWEQFLLQSFIGFAISLYGYKKDMAEVDAEEEQEDVIYYIPKVRTHGDYCKNPYYN
jgi:conserved domain protein